MTDVPSLPLHVPLKKKYFCGEILQKILYRKTFNLITQRWQLEVEVRLHFCFIILSSCFKSFYLIMSVICIPFTAVPSYIKFLSPFLRTIPSLSFICTVSCTFLQPIKHLHAATSYQISHKHTQTESL